MADTALITTTINCPTVLRQYRASDPDVLFVIAGDRKTPHDEVNALCRELGNAVYLTPLDQERLGYACSEVIGWNSIQRRNIALLEALRLGAQVVVSVDDDNAPYNETYFEDLQGAFHGVCTGEGVCQYGWFNLGIWADTPFIYRGFPFSLRDKPISTLTGVVSVEAENRRIGVVNGLIYGDPDINAIDRYKNPPFVRRYGGAVRRGVCINPRTTWTPINSQNTAYVRELAPLAFVLPGIGRYDDIWASYMALRVMEATDYHVYFGEPSVIQERNPHNWLKDLENEMYGMRLTEQFCADLKAVKVDEGASILENLERVRLGVGWLPQQTRDFLRCYLDDVARVL